VLASASPRRRELLGHLGIAYSVEASCFDERSLAHLTDGREYVRAAARAKAGEVAARRSGWILGVDTDVVAPDGAILGKPGTAQEAAAMLRRLSGRTHTVYSGMALLQSVAGQVVSEATEVVATKVTLGALCERAIAAYVESGEPFDKAGGYGMQGGAMAFVTAIDGDPSNVIGLPLWSLAQMLEEAGFVLWNVPTL
jgi:septum formation protein